MDDDPARLGGVVLGDLGSSELSHGGEQLIRKCVLERVGSVYV